MNPKLLLILFSTMFIHLYVYILFTVGILFTYLPLHFAFVILPIPTFIHIISHIWILEKWFPQTHKMIKEI